MENPADAITYEQVHLSGDDYEIVLNRGTCFSMNAMDNSGMFCLDDTAKVFEGESVQFNFELYCCCDEE